jgi:hypothetical protein
MLTRHGSLIFAITQPLHHPRRPIQRGTLAR